MIKKTMLLIFTIVIFCISSFYLFRVKPENSFSINANKIILFIGDGMGENHLKVAEKYLNKELYMRSFNYQGYVSTFSKNIFYPTDSAASATAFATGQKVNNKEIAFHKGNLLTISEIAKEKNYGVGIVTTDYLYGATPACFSSHASLRSETEIIIENQIESGIDIFIGRGKDEYSNYQEKIINNGYNYITSYNELLNYEKKLFLVIEEMDDLKLLKDTSLFALSYLENKYPQGYFLLIEGAHIDKMSHDNDIFKMISYLDEFDKTINAVYEKIKTQKDYLIIVTSDHETGNLQYKNEINNSLYKSGGHTSKNVLYFIQSSNEIIIPKKIDNTDIFKMCFSAINIRGKNESN